MRGAALTVVMLWTATASAAGLPALAPDDWRRVDRGETVLHERTVPGYPWPEVVAYRRPTAPPAAVMAVWADFGAQVEWVPALVESRVLARETANAVRVFYEYEVAGPNERYTVVVRVMRDGDAWHARWTLVTARYARRLEGALLVLPRGEGSLLVYSSRVDPGTLGATFGSPASVARSLAGTADALAARTERLAATEPARLTRLVDGLAALAR